MSVQGKVIIVTGASRGIGSAVATLMAAHGAKVIVNYSNSEAAANATVKAIEEQGGTAIAVKADVRHPEEVAFLFDEAQKAFGQVDVLVNNAGTMISKLLKDTTEEDFDQQFDVNVKGTFNTLRAASSKLADGGSIINFSSSTAKLMFPTYAIYSGTKAAVEQMTRVFSKEIGRGISVNAVAPGPTETDLFMDGKTPEMLERLKGMNAFNRLGQPIDIARVVLFLASDESKWISGQVIGANGAMV